MERDARNRSLGRVGESFVIDLERRRLTQFDRGDLARKVRWVAAEDGDGAGYDVLIVRPAGARAVDRGEDHEWADSVLPDAERARPQCREAAGFGVCIGFTFSPRPPPSFLHRGAAGGRGLSACRNLERLLWWPAGRAPLEAAATVTLGERAVQFPQGVFCNPEDRARTRVRVLRPDERVAAQFGVSFGVQP